VISSRNIYNQLYAEQVSMLYDALPISIFSNIIISFVLVFAEWAVLGHNQLITWFVLMTVVQSLRAIFFIGYHHFYDAVDVKRWSHLFVFGSIATALTWAGNIIFLFPATIEYQVFLAFVVAGMSAGAVASLSSLRVTIFSYLIILLLPLIIRLFLQGGTIGNAMGLMVTVFLVMVASTANRMYKNTRQNIEMKYEAIHMDEALKESEKKYHHIFESVPIGIAYYSHDGVILDCNSVYRDLTGLSDDKIRTWNLLEDGGDDDFNQKVATSLEKHIIQHEGQASVIGGDELTSIRVVLTAIKLEKENLSEGLAIVEDITEDKRVEKAKQDFISSVSHELRTPLTSIQAALGLIEGGSVGDISEPVKPLVEIANRNSQRLISLINDILELGEMKTGEILMHPAIILVKFQVEDALSIMQPYAAQYDVAFKLSCDDDSLSVYVDEKRFSQILCNLVSNAAKFSPPGSEVTVKIKRVNDKVRIEVVDRGTGIPEEFHDEIFERFTQYDNSETRSVGGSGLGLNISKQLVTQMNGEIGFTTELGRGTTFFIEFPISE